jgi:hypothetical protein
MLILNENAFDRRIPGKIKFIKMGQREEKFGEMKNYARVDDIMMMRKGNSLVINFLQIFMFCFFFNRQKFHINNHSINKSTANYNLQQSH